MEDKTYEIKIPKVKKASYTETPYISKNPVLRFLDFFDFGLPYRSTKFKLLMVPVYFVMGEVLALLIVTLTSGSVDIRRTGGFSVPIFPGVLFLVGMLFTLKKRDVKSYGFIFWGLYGEEVNVGRILRYVGIYLIYVLPIIGCLMAFIYAIGKSFLGRYEEFDAPIFLFLLSILFVFVIPYCVKSEDKKE